MSIVLHGSRLNATLRGKSNTTFNNKLFTVLTIGQMHETAKRLYEAAKNMKGVEGQSAVARLLNESPQNLNNWEARGVSKQGAIKAQAIIGCDANWILNGSSEYGGTNPAPLFSAEEPWVEYQPVRPGKFNFVPVLGQGAGGDMPERLWTDGDFPVGQTNEYAEVISTDPHAFIVRVVGPSMIPKFNPGDYALVEPGTDADIEDDVLVRLANGQTMLKRLLSRRGGLIRLGSYNNAETLVYEKGEVTWLYYVPYPVPARKIKSRV